MTTTISRPPLSGRLASNKVIAVLRAAHVSALAPVCEVLVDEGILGLEPILSTGMPTRLMLVLAPSSLSQTPNVPSNAARSSWSRRP